MTADDAAAVLALVTGGALVSSEADLPVPPNGCSESAQALWYALLSDFEFGLGEIAVLEQIVATKSHLDEVESDWRASGSPTTTTGSMGQLVTDPRISEMRQLRGQYAALIKQLDLPGDGTDMGKKRPGRPTRSESRPDARWGGR